MSLLNELKRRNVLRVGAAYVVASWLLIQVAETIFPLFGFDGAPARIVVIILTIGFFPTLIFAWVFEFTPDGLMMEKNVDRSVSVTHHTGKKLDRMIIAALTLSLAYFAVDKFVLDPARDAERDRIVAQETRESTLAESAADDSIAVLAFADMSELGDQEYFSDGISEELLNLLVRIPELRVTARTSAFSYKGKNVSIVQIGEELNVSYVLEGSIRKQNQDVRITAQLIEAKSDSHLFSETYDVTLDNVFTVQDEIAAKIVESIKLTIFGEVPKATPVDPEAYDLYLRGQYLNNTPTQENMSKAVTLLNRSIEIDPGYAPAWVSLGITYRNQAQYGYRDIKTGTEEARSAFHEAIRLDPARAKAWSKLAVVYLAYDWDFDSANEAIEKARKLEPNNSSVISVAAIIAMTLGSVDEAVELRHNSVAAEPLSLSARLLLSWDLIVAKHFAEAEKNLLQLLEMDQAYPIAHLLLGQIYLLTERQDMALAEMQLEPEVEWRQFGVVLALHALGKHKEELERRAEYIAEYGNVWMFQVAQMYAFHGDIDSGINWLNRAYDERDSGMTLVRTDLFLHNLRDDPRWDQLLQRMGLSE